MAALVLLAIVLGLGPLASLIPHAVLAGILMKVGIDIIDWGYLKRAPRAPRAGVVIMLVVLGLTVFVDLIIAFATGMVAASLLFVKRMSDLQMSSVRATRNGEADEDGGMNLSAAEQALLDGCAHQIILYYFAGPVSFGAAKGMARQLVLDDAHHILVLDFTDVPLVDTTGAFAIDDILARAQSLGASVHLAGMSAGVHGVLERLGVFERINADHIHATRLAALTAATAEP
ncbi:MAG: SulP family inorganic anion transporter [Rhodospirillaceae bacterium]|nr:SulP family inorganic anion transporter [Rhodospirillaceae bacterium]MBT3886230.1 SulP family inorganic anion transporter [Rhodospirillaceae bacterium]MBT4116555.1 SulP family inorganic anion transporter [Rhodospirillaceae bacterium]MBT4673029.1 SulP family inorganic anion transporter [Rhodospirillaceae bacterium]MBT4721882.1 SulP family inorganic anion transporter [Rhodospirillaceae bacterium]